MNFERNIFLRILKVNILADKLNKFPSKKKKKKKKKQFINFYWNRDMTGKSNKVKAYKKNKF